MENILHKMDKILMKSSFMAPFGRRELERIAESSSISGIKMVGLGKVGKYRWVIQMVRPNSMIGFWLLMVATRQQYVTTQWTICHATLQLMFRQAMDGNVIGRVFQLINHMTRAPINRREICMQIFALMQKIT
jgi:hypothetical protein